MNEFFFSIWFYFFCTLHIFYKENVLTNFKMFMYLLTLKKVKMKESK